MSSLLGLCLKSFRINFGVKAAQITDRKLIRIALIRINLRSLRPLISASFHARNCLKNFLNRALDFFLTVLLVASCLSGCAKPEDAEKKKVRQMNAQAEYIYRNEEDRFFPLNEPKPSPREQYPWEAKSP